MRLLEGFQKERRRRRGEEIGESEEERELGMGGEIWGIERSKGQEQQRAVVGSTYYQPWVLYVGHSPTPCGTRGILLLGYRFEDGVLLILILSFDFVCF